MKKVNSIEYLKTQKEGQYFDRKSARSKPEDILPDMCAFANANGGRLCIGIENDGEVTGFKIDGAKLKEDFENIEFRFRETPIKFTTTSIDVINNNGKEDVVLLIDVEVSNDRVIKTHRDSVYLRQNDESVKLTLAQVRNLEYDRGQRYFEDEVVEDATLDDLDINLIRQYKQKLDVQLVDDKQFLKSRGFVKRNFFTNAAVILFAKNPTEFLPQVRVRFRRFEGNKLLVGESFNVIKDKEFSGPLVTVVNEIKSFVSIQLREFQKLTLSGKFESIPEYPEFAWLEGIVNAVTHRDYTIRGEYIRINMFDDRIEIISPGNLPNIVTLENMKYERYSRNPRIARMMVDFGWVREANEGVNRIYKEMEEFFLKSPTFLVTLSKLELTLENNILHRNERNLKEIEKMIDFEYSKLSSNEKMIILYLVNLRKEITTKSVMALLSVNRNTAISVLSKLVEKNIIKLYARNSTDPYQYYYLNLNS